MMDVDIGLLVRVICALLGMVLLIYCLRRLIIAKMPLRTMPKSMVVIDSITLPHQHSVWLIEVDKRRLIIANTKDSCHVLKAFEE